MITAWVFVGLCVALSLFQLALIGGAPWGHLTQGGLRQGVLTSQGKAVAGLSMLIAAAMALAILSAADVWPHWPAWAGWLAVGLTGLSALGNWASRSRPERRVWGPVSLVMLACGLRVMVS